MGPEHRITLVSRRREFTFFPSLVRLAFGRIKLEDVFFDLEQSMRSRGIVLTQAEVAGYDPDKRYVVVRRGRLDLYAAGYSVNFPGPKMGHMAVLQGEIAAANLAAEIEGREPEADYDHELLLVIDEGDEDSIYLHHKPWDKEGSALSQGRFWSWAKRAHTKYWTRLHALKPV